MESLTVTRIRPVPPYDMRLSARGTAGGTRRWQGAVLVIALTTDAGEGRAAVRQRHDGELEVAVRAPDAPSALDQVRFMLATRDDHSPFLRLARRDPRMAPVVVRHAGFRPARTGTVAHSLVSAVCGQLITGREAARMERAVVGMTGAPGADGLMAPPTSAAVAALAPARAASSGLAARRAAAMTRFARAMDLQRLHGVSTAAMTARVTREPWLGPWSAGVIGTHGLGRFDSPVVGDLGLMRIVAAETGRWPEAEDTHALLTGYGEWSGLASAYLLLHPLARTKQGAPRARAA
jgi:3-methyladenine DNA glycosylase/8-oxoguanine DNA glycosylase